MHYSEITMTLDERAAFLKANAARYSPVQHDRKIQRLASDRVGASMHGRMVEDFMAAHSGNR